MKDGFGQLGTEPSARARWARRSRSRLSFRPWWPFPAAAALAVVALGALRLERDADKPVLACRSIAECQATVAGAAARLRACRWGCRESARAHVGALRALYRAEERARVRRHYERRSELEQQEAEAKQSAREAQFARQAQRAADAAEREQRHRLELAALRFEQRQRRQQLERERLLVHYARLGSAAREVRLEHCLRGPAAACDNLLSLLLDAAASDEEREALIRRFAAGLRPREAAPEKASRAAASRVPRAGKRGSERPRAFTGAGAPPQPHT